MNDNTTLTVIIVLFLALIIVGLVASVKAVFFKPNEDSLIMLPVSYYEQLNDRITKLESYHVTEGE